MERELGELRVVVTAGNIAAQTGVDAVVNAANAQLRPGGGVAGAIHRAAGPELDKECRPLAPILPGNAVITGGYGLPNDYVIHCLGPVYGHDQPSERLLGDCYRNALKLADDYQLSSIAFPSISTGVFGYPMKAAAQVALRAVVAEAAGLKHVREVRFVLFGEEALRIHEQALLGVMDSWTS
jgi:O-acetyl-ADP-ribose deacetylase (regulator of RNase III)